MSFETSQPFGKGRKLTLTILGKSGSGKTVFLSSLYCRLAGGAFGFTAAASDDETDRKLGGFVERLFLKNEPPEGTTENFIKYAFSLMFEGDPIAEFDCFDYRGGATGDDAGSESGNALHCRIVESDIIMWLIDLSETRNVDTLRARLMTNLRRLQSICSQAIRKEPRLRIWSFVRTKVDADYPDLTSEDLLQATQELETHLGDVLAISTYGNAQYATLISIAPIGRVVKDESGFTAGVEAVNVEWPLLTSLVFLINVRVRDLDEQVDAAQRSASAAEGKRPRLFGSRPEASSVEPSQAISEAERERDFLTRILARIKERMPKSIMVHGPADD